ncbi:MAG: hypothetical protein ABW000_11010 [Actinoplanes sp.]
MSIGSLSPSTFSAAGMGSADGSGNAAKARETTEGATTTIAEHVASADEHEPIRSVSLTQGTLVDTYL